MKSDLKELLQFFDGSNPVIEVFHEGPDNPFICAVVGAIDVVQLQRIEEDIEACHEFADGPGVYWFRCEYQPARYDGVTYGFIQGDEWHCEQIKYTPFVGEALQPTGRE